MAEDTPADDTPVTFHIKSSSDAKYVLTIPLSTTVADLKQKLSTSEYADIAPERQRLIYSGRVLKDPDTLATYKIKEGNTVHLVKGAASNQRQNPANQASSTAGTGTAQGAQGVPQNLAAGTGRDPLTALTGARYAGSVQMPNANMFGPDGGMGPPPDPEHMASMLENPNFASTLNEALSNPDVIEQMIRSNPMFQGPMGQQARQMLQDPNFRRMMTDPATLRQMNEMRRSMPEIFGDLGGMGMMGGGGRGGDGGFPMPGATDTTPATATNGARSNAQGQNTTGSPSPSQAASPPPMNPFAMFAPPGAAGAGGAAAAGGANPFAALFGLNPANNPLAGGNNSNNNNTGSAAAGTGSDTRDASQPQQQQQQQQIPTNPFSAMTQQLMANPQLMQQMLAAISGAPPNNNNNNNPSDPTNPSTAAGGGGGGAPAYNPFAALQALQNLTAAGGGGGGFGGFGSDLFNPAGAGAGGGTGAAAAPRDDRPPEDRYAEQLRQLNEMGFYEFERNVEALRRTGGSVQGAVEYLLTH